MRWRRSSARLAGPRRIGGRRLAGVAAVGALIACGGCLGQAGRPIAVGDPMPSIAVPTLDDDTVRVGRGTGRQPLTLVNIWATWCSPCHDEFPELEALHRAYAPRGLRVVGVSIDRDGAALVRPFVTDRGATFTIALDPGDAVRGRYLARGIPESWLVAPDGRLLWRQVGAIPAGSAEARAAIDAALARGAPVTDRGTSADTRVVTGTHDLPRRLLFRLPGDHRVSDRL